VSSSRQPLQTGSCVDCLAWGPLRWRPRCAAYMFNRTHAKTWQRCGDAAESFIAARDSVACAGPKPAVVLALARRFAAADSAYAREPPGVLYRHAHSDAFTFNRRKNRRRADDVHWRCPNRSNQPKATGSIGSSKPAGIWANSNVHRTGCGRGGAPAATRRAGDARRRSARGSPWLVLTPTV
jgi:hypothetical protein